MNGATDLSLSHTPQLGGIHNRFGTDLLEGALKTLGKNALLSPTSIAILLAMLHAGARVVAGRHAPPTQGRIYGQRHRAGFHVGDLAGPA